MQILPYLHIRIDGRDLRQESDAALCLDRLLRNVIAIDDDRSAGGRDDTCHDVQRGGLSGAVGAEKAEDFVFFYGKADPFQGGFMSIVLGQILNFNHKKLLSVFS